MNRILISILTFIGASLLCGCADDLSPDVPSSGSLIRFDVAVSSGRSIAGGSRKERARSGSYSRGRVIEMKGSDSPLYLLSEMTEGIRIESAGETTRGIPQTSAGIESFGVYADRSDAPSGALPEYMRNVEVTRGNDWTPVRDYFWPADSPLRFSAYSPYVAEASGTEGITRLPDTENPSSLEYVVPTAYESQLDLMWATPVEADASPCALSFSHALTAVRFSAGSQLAAVTIKSITLSGLLSGGTLDLSSGTWSETKGNATFSVSPSVTLVADAATGYVTPDTPLLAEGTSFLLLPQTLGEDARVSVVIESGGEERTLDASLASEVWSAGKTVTYRISANPYSDTLILDVEGDLSSPYTGATLPFSVNSYIDGEERTPVSWRAELVDADGNSIATPQWVESFTAEGSGNSDGSVVTVMNGIVYHAMSAPTQKLHSASDINSSSGYTPYNLSSSTGAPTPEETANTYIISAPGKYSLPLVYGNAIKGGTVNSAAYTTTSHNRYALKNFVNHLGNGITDPYIYNNSGCEPTGASIVWSAELGMIQDVRLSDDKHSLLFEVPAEGIREGNAIVAVTDADGNILWSWQIWETDFNYSTGIDTLPSSSGNFRMWNKNLGYVAGGDDVEFPAAQAYIRFYQTDVPEGMEPKSVTLPLTQDGKRISTPEGNTFYQWGRKDPMLSTVKQWYGASGAELQTLPTLSVGDAAPTISDLQKWWILHPQTLVSASHDVAISYTNLWNVSLSTTSSVKSVYDPSPVGSKVDLGTRERDWGRLSTTVSGSNYQITFSDGSIASFPKLGYRSAVTGNLNGQGTMADYWFATCMSSRNSAISMSVDQNFVQTQTNSIYMAFSVRPVIDE